jgi:NAD(P)-dependent dehydrogenase (short-subunit alcohol dehydrogenase family)
MKKLMNKVAVITGGSGGIGMATARLFLEEGAKVMLVDLDEKTLKEAVAKLNSKNVVYCAADVSTAKDVKRYVSETHSKLGPIDIFFNNAGIEGKTRPIAAYPEEVYDKVMAVNVKGVWLGCQEVLPVMNNGGSMMITSSVAGLRGFANLGAYVASKHAVVGIMRVAALEFAEKGIRVNTIHPGPVNNRMMRAIEADMAPDNPEEVQKGFEATIPLGRYGENEEMAQLALFLASDDSKYITGTTQVIDGGMVMH